MNELSCFFYFAITSEINMQGIADLYKSHLCSLNKLPSDLVNMCEM